MFASKNSLHRLPQIFSLLAVVGLAAGCGVDHSPVAQTEVTVTQAPDGRSFLTFSPRAAQRAAKLASGDDIELLDQMLREDLQGIIGCLEGMVPDAPGEDTAEAQLAEKLDEVIAETSEALEKLELPEPKKKDAVGKLRKAEEKLKDLSTGNEPLMAGEAVSPIIDDLKRIQRDLRRKDWARIYDAQLLPIEQIDLIGGTIEAWHEGCDPEMPEAEKLGKVLNKAYEALGELTEHTPPKLGDAIHKLEGAVEEFQKAVEDGILEEVDTADLVEELIETIVQLERTDSELVEFDHDKELKVEKKHESGDEDDIIIEFLVPEFAVTEDVLINMTVYGHSLDDLIVAFEPGGLYFEQEATLDMLVGNDLFPPEVLEALTAYHLHADGSEDEVGIILIEPGDKRTRICVSVPGFSRYGLRD
jgi:hypothetical protein